MDQEALQHSEHSKVVSQDFARLQVDTRVMEINVMKRIAQKHECTACAVLQGYRRNLDYAAEHRCPSETE